ncbi:MAG: hypothetical protein ACOC2L_05490 [Candidatus Sumerlaeota bacterium]
MSNAQTFLTDEQQQSIVDAIAETEKQTSAELVCALSTESGRYDRAEAIAGLFGSLLALGLVHMILNWGEQAMWGGQESAGLWLQAIAVVGGFVVGSVLASFCHPFRYLLTLEREMAVEAERAAARVFATQGLHKTNGRGGFLLYISLYERRMIIRADSAVLEAVGSETLDRWCEMAGEDLGKGLRAESFLDVIEAAREELSEKLPIREGDVDELPNHFLIYHPRP